MAAAQPRQNEPDQAGPAVPRERASADYENPRENVADMPNPVEMPTTKARAGESRGHMRWVLGGGILLTILGYFLGYYIFFSG